MRRSVRGRLTYLQLTYSTTMENVNGITALLFAMLLNSGLAAQVIDLGTVPNRLLVVRSLPEAGVKLYSRGSGSITLYNLDLTVYATINYPALPAGYTYFDVLYFTESTFDNDPTTIELMMLTQDASTPMAISGTRVIREDGTVVFDDLTHGFSGTGGYHELNSKPPLFVGEDGVTYMLLTNYPMVNPGESKLYQLPGNLPCIDCTGTHAIATGTEEIGGGTATLTLYPNPATDRIRVESKLPVSSEPARLMITDALGQVVDIVALDQRGNGTFSMAGRASGSYTCSLVIHGRVVAAEPLVLMQ